MEEKMTKRSQNKQKKREQIIASAERLLIEKKFDKTSIEDVAKQSGFTIRTIYRYFISKEDLFFAVVLEASKKYIMYAQESIRGGESALEKIKLSNQAYCRFYFDNPDLFRLMNFQPDNLLNCEASPNRNELLALKNAETHKIEAIIEEGKKDGSINVNLDTKQSVYFGLLTSMGLLNLVSNMDKRFFWESYGLDEVEFLNFSMDLLAEALT